MKGFTEISLVRGEKEKKKRNSRSIIGPFERVPELNVPYAVFTRSTSTVINSAPRFTARRTIGIINLDKVTRNQRTLAHGIPLVARNRPSCTLTSFTSLGIDNSPRRAGRDDFQLTILTHGFSRACTAYYVRMILERDRSEIIAWNSIGRGSNGRAGDITSKLGRNAARDKEQGVSEKSTAKLFCSMDWVAYQSLVTRNGERDYDSTRDGSAKFSAADTSPKAFFKKQGREADGV